MEAKERFDEQEADIVVKFMECLRIPDGKHAGEQFRLMEWQREPVREFYGTLTERGFRKYRYLYLEIPKKNGKTGLAAALGLYHTFADGEINGEVYCVAADRENAGICFKAALDMLRMCPALEARARVTESVKLIKDTVTGTIFKVMSSEAYSKHGYKPSCVIFDELHAQPNRELWDIMTFGAGATRNQPVWIVLTTAGNDPDRNSIGWEIHEKARGILAARSGQDEYEDNPYWLPVIYGYYGDDIYNEEHWKEANPAIKYGHSVTMDDIRQEAMDARQSEGAERLFRWLRLNQWIAVKDVGWLPLALWDETEGVTREALAGEKCYLGMDLSTTTDLTAVTAIFPPTRGRSAWAALFWAWIPRDRLMEAAKRDKTPYVQWVEKGYLTATEGDAVDYTAVHDTINAIRAQYKVQCIGVDPWNSRMLTQELMAEGLEVAEIPQNMAGMSPPMKDMELLLRKKLMLHETNPLARWCFGNVRCSVDGNENIKPMKNRSTGRIDVIVSWINAVAIARTKTSMRPNVYETRGPRMITF